MPLAAGTRLGPYEIVAPLGKGGMGEVYRARDTRLRRDVAIKVVQHGHSDPSLWDRFEREARAASALSHPNICSIFDTGEAEGLPYLVMELLEGQTLRELIGTRPMEPGAAVAIAVQIADALEAAHAKGILHRDIKPGNVMIVGRSHVKVLDFGLAKQTGLGESNETATLGMETETGSVVGTPAYLAPELLQGAKADARSDLWALGVVLYQMLSGELPFKGATTFEISSAILKEQPPPLQASVPLRLRGIVERCLEKRPERRYQGAGEVRISLEELQTKAKAAPPNRRVLWGAVGAVVAVAIVSGLVWQRQAGRMRTGSTGAPVSVNQEANDLFEVGINAQMVQNDIPKAQEMYERALVLDPHFAEALRLHALDYVILLLNGYTNDTNSLYRAETELRQVAQENPDSFSLPASQAAVYMTQGRRDLVPLERLERAGQEYPLQADTNVWRIIFKMMAEEDVAAKDLANDILKPKSLSGTARMFLGEILRTEGDSAGAIREELKVLDQAPGNISAIQFLVRAYLDHGDLEEAHKLLEAKRPLFSNNYMWRQGWAVVLAAEGKRDEALDAMDEETRKFAAAAFVSTSLNADFYALLGDREKAIEWLDKAVRNGDERVGYFQRNPRLASVQKEPGFRRIVDSIEARRANLPRDAHHN
jgi:tetratricopeptide (TPR) repeat protein